MTQHIKQLPPQLANQIAAGEVVERPASVVKELLENSLDAGARHISVDIEKAGTALIRIRDNGQGISAEDLPLAIDRHATSKIATVADLQCIKSLGFRGEALASISSVSNMAIRSKTEQSAHGNVLSINKLDGKVELTACSHPQGTTIEVRDLFFNIPARRKFLRSERTELSHIEECIKGMALSHFHVAFNMSHNQRRLYQLPAINDAKHYQQRVQQICGKQFIDNALAIDCQVAQHHLWGWLGLAEIARSQSDCQYIYLNGRLIKDRVINHAIRQAYQDHLYEGRYPCYVLYLELPHDTVDVNVHPTKHEVRFHDSRMVHDFISRHIKEALDNHSIGQYDAVIPEVPQQQLVEDENTVNYAKPYQAHSNHPPRQQIREQLQYYQTSNDFHSKAEQIVDSILDTNQSQQQDCDLALTQQAVPSKPNLTITNKFLGIIDDKYILVQDHNSLIFMDFQKASYEQNLLKCQNASQQSPLVAQPLLFPKTISLTEKQIQALENHNHHLLLLAIDINPISPTQIMIRRLPAMLRECEHQKVIESIADYFNTIQQQLDDQQRAQLNQIIATASSNILVTPKQETINQLIHDYQQHSPEQKRAYSKVFNSNDIEKLMKC